MCSPRDMTSVPEWVMFIKGWKHHTLQMNEINIAIVSSAVAVLQPHSAVRCVLPLLCACAHYQLHVCVVRKSTGWHAHSNYRNGLYCLHFFAINVHFWLPQVVSYCIILAHLTIPSDWPQTYEASPCTNVWSADFKTFIESLYHEHNKRKGSMDNRCIFDPTKIRNFALYDKAISSYLKHL